ncbi:PHP domain-containing protein [bacterium]|nr:PHP domain-containing protein [bacterium]
MLETARLSSFAGRLVMPARRLDHSILRSDLHLHTTFTDGRSTVLEMLQAAARQGLQTVAFTEHVRRGITWFEGFREQVQRDRLGFPDLEVLVGIEAKAFDCHGGLDADPALIAQADLVLGAFHNYPDRRGGFVPATALSAEEAAELEFEASWALLDHPEVDVLAHPGALTRKFFGEFPEPYLRELVEKAAARGRAIELNGEYNSPEQLGRLITWCREADAWVTLGSNAHHASEVGRIAALVTEVEGYVH